MFCTWSGFCPFLHSSDCSDGRSVFPPRRHGDTHAELIDAYGMGHKRWSCLIEAMWHTFDIRYYKHRARARRVSSCIIGSEWDLFPFVALLFWSMVKQMVFPIRVGDTVNGPNCPWAGGGLTHTRVYYVWGDFFTYWPFQCDIYLLFGVGVLCEVLAVRHNYRTNIKIYCMCGTSFENIGFREVWKMKTNNITELPTLWTSYAQIIGESV